MVIFILMSFLAILTALGLGLHTWRTTISNSQKSGLGGKDIGEVCPIHLLDRYNFRKQRLQAHIKAIVQSKVNLDDNCIYSLVPRHVLRHFYQLKNEITDWVIENHPKPKNYSHLVDSLETINQISQQELQIDWDNHNLLFIQDPKAKALYKRHSKSKSFINYNIFGTITGRLSTLPNSFPIMNLKYLHKVLCLIDPIIFVIDVCTKNIQS